MMQSNELKYKCKRSDDSIRKTYTGKALKLHKGISFKKETRLLKTSFNKAADKTKRTIKMHNKEHRSMKDCWQSQLKKIKDTSLNQCVNACDKAAHKTQKYEFSKSSKGKWVVNNFILTAQPAPKQQQYPQEQINAEESLGFFMAESGGIEPPEYVERCTLLQTRCA